MVRVRKSAESRHFAAKKFESLAVDWSIFTPTQSGTSFEWWLCALVPVAFGRLYRGL
jgi:hypothetical protein